MSVFSLGAKGIAAEAGEGGRHRCGFLGGSSTGGRQDPLPVPMGGQSCARVPQPLHRARRDAALPGDCAPRPAGKS